jgi:hypothetical protein
VDFADAKGGNRIQYYDQASAANLPYRFLDEQHPNIIAGLHMEWAPGVDTLILASRLDDTYAVTNPFTPGFLTIKDLQGPAGTILGILPFTAAQNYHSTLEIYSAEVQQIWQTHRFTTIAGVRWQGGDFRTKNFEESFDPNLDGFGISGTIADQNVSADFDRETVYGYEQWQALESLRVIGGLSYDRLVIPENFRGGPVSMESSGRYHLLPKGGVIWTPLKDTTVRAGFSQSIGGASFDQSFQLEPTQIAGFNQAFRSLIPDAVGGANAGATFTVYGLSLEQKLPTRTYLALEASLLKSKVSREDGTLEFNDQGGPFLSQMGEELNYTEWSLTGSAHQLVGRDWVFGLVYQLSHARLVDDFTDLTPDNAAANNFTKLYDHRATLHLLDLSAIYQNPCGFFARVDGIWTHQDNDGFDMALQNDDFWQCNLQAGWRFLHRHAEITVGILNLTDQDYNLNPLNLYTETPRTRTFFTELKFHY